MIDFHTKEPTTSIKASQIGKKGRSRTFGRGRVCSEEGCGTKLSMYNPRDTCFEHTPLKVPRLRGEYLRKDS